MRPALVTLSLILLLFAAGCVKNAPDSKTGEDYKSEKSAVENNDKGFPEKNDFSPTPEFVVKTENSVSDKDASAMLDEVDNQLSDLLNSLDRLDDVDDKKIHY